MSMRAKVSALLASVLNYFGFLYVFFLSVVAEAETRYFQQLTKQNTHKHLVQAMG
jgi:hypothetical protein